jgi:hypothetical protein
MVLLLIFQSRRRGRTFHVAPLGSELQSFAVSPLIVSSIHTYRCFPTIASSDSTLYCCHHCHLRQ